MIQLAVSIGSVHEVTARVEIILSSAIRIRCLVCLFLGFCTTAMNETTQSQGERESDCFNVTDAKELMELGASIRSAAALSNINEMLSNNEDTNLATPPFRTLTSATKVFPPKQMSDLSETPPNTEGDNVAEPPFHAVTNPTIVFPPKLEMLMNPAEIGENKPMDPRQKRAEKSMHPQKDPPWRKRPRKSEAS